MIEKNLQIKNKMNTIEKKSTKCYNTNQKYISVQGLNKSITIKIKITERLELYKAWKRWSKKKL